MLFVMGSAIITLVWRNGKRYGQMATDIKSIAKDVTKVSTALDKHIEWHLRITRGGRG